MKVSKSITILPANYQSVRLEVSEAETFSDCNNVLRKELQRYERLIPKDQLSRLKEILKD